MTTTSIAFRPGLVALPQRGVVTRLRAVEGGNTTWLLSMEKDMSHHARVDAARNHNARAARDLDRGAESDLAPGVEDGFTRLRSATADRALVVVGGAARGSLDKLAKQLGLAIERVPTQHLGIHVVHDLADRIRRGSVAAVVVIEGFMRHKQILPVQRAAAATNIPFAFGGRGGVGAVGRALDEIERALSRAADSGA